MPDNLLDVWGGIIGAAGVAVYAALARHADADGVCYPSIDRIAKLAGVSKRHAKSVVRDLERKRLISVRRSPGRAPNVYQLNPLNGAQPAPLAPSTVHSVHLNGAKSARQRCTACTPRAIKEGLPKKGEGAPAFAAPSLEDVRALCQQQGYTFDPETFFAYYQSNAWTQGNGRPVQDWRACALAWQKREGSFGRNGKPGRPVGTREEIAERIRRERARYAAEAQAALPSAEVVFKRGDDGHPPPAPTPKPHAGHGARAPVPVQAPVRGVPT